MEDSNPATLRQRYAAIQAEATLLAGDTLDIPRRVVLLLNLFRDSGGNHAFSLVAAHGALWAYQYFEVGGTLGRLVAQRYFYNRQERAFRLGLLQSFAEGFRTINRQVCIDTYTNYHFTREYGQLPGAEELVPPKLLEALNRVHAARSRSQSFTAAEQRDVFEQSFHCEQEVTVAPGVAVAVQGFDCRILKALCLRPLVRFAFFPALNYLMFRNFAEKEERIAKGMRCFELAQRVGWTRVEQSLQQYGVMPRQCLLDPEQSLRDTKSRLLHNAALTNVLADRFK